MSNPTRRPKPKSRRSATSAVTQPAMSSAAESGQDQPTTPAPGHLGGIFTPSAYYTGRGAFGFTERFAR